MEREEVTIPVYDAGLAPVTQRSLTSFGMTTLLRLAQCVDAEKAVIPNEVRDLSLPPRRYDGLGWAS